MTTPTTAPAVTPDMLAAHPVWRLLDAAQRESWAPRFTVVASLPPRGLSPDDMQQRLGWLLDGTMTLFDADDNQCRHTLPVGGLFGLGATPDRGPPRWAARLLGPGSVAFLEAEALIELMNACPMLAAQLWMPQHRVTTATDTAPAVALEHLSIRRLLSRPPVTVPAAASVLEVAKLMHAQGVSSVMLVEPAASGGERLAGVVTDRDLRNRVVAVGLSPASPALEIATTTVQTVQATQPVFTATLLMARHRIHHLPVMDGERIAGMVTSTDLQSQQATSPVMLAAEIQRQSTVEGLAALAGRVAGLQRHLAATEAGAYSTGHIVTAITDAYTQRLLELAEARLGPAPVPFVWVAAGSQARSEQTAKSDQDNCLVLDDSYDAASHGEYYAALSRFVCDGLAACGYIHCPGEMMAMTDQWRQPLAVWRGYFEHWIGTPEPKSLMLTAVFFDQRAIAGDASLLTQLRTEVLQATRGNRLFLAHMVRNALSRQPPLGVFGGISTLREPEHRGRIDMKHHGVVPIVDLARVYALAGGLPEVNTDDRLARASESGEISVDSARDLREALAIIANARLQHQARQTAAGVPPDNYLAPSELGTLERGQLKDAFAVVQKLQQVLASRYRF